MVCMYTCTHTHYFLKEHFERQSESMQKRQGEGYEMNAGVDRVSDILSEVPVLHQLTDLKQKTKPSDLSS